MKAETNITLKFTKDEFNTLADFVEMIEDVVLSNDSIDVMDHEVLVELLITLRSTKGMPDSKLEHFYDDNFDYELLPN